MNSWLKCEMKNEKIRNNLWKTTKNKKRKKKIEELKDGKGSGENEENRK